MRALLKNRPPPDFGFPDKFSSWRPVQIDALEDALYCGKRFAALALGTGTGKSLLGMAMAVMTQKRTLVLTSTKGLQDQLVGDFDSCGLKDIRGRRNYECEGYQDSTCDESADICREGGCPYKAAYETACNGRLVVTNYAYWLAMGKRRDGLGVGDDPFEILILDEAHAGEAELSNFLCTEIGDRDVEMLKEEIDEKEESIELWARWATERLPKVSGMVAKYEAAIKEQLRDGRRADRRTARELKKWKALEQKLENVAGMKPEEWVCEVVGKGKYTRAKFDVVWPGRYAEKWLFRGIEKVLLVSATIRPKTMGLLGVSEDKYEFKEYPFQFDRKRCPVYHVPTARVNFTSSDADRQAIVTRTDQYVRKGRDMRKGIVHTTSYAWQKFVKSQSEYKDCMTLNDRNGDEGELVSDVVREFKLSSPPRILVSPSISTGYDFPGDECRWQVITKVPFVDTRSKVMQARKERDRQYPDYLAMQKLVQACGRPMRSADDWCETVVIDDVVEKFMVWAGVLKPGWFWVEKVGSIPEAMEV